MTFITLTSNKPLLTKTDRQTETEIERQKETEIHGDRGRSKGRDRESQAVTETEIETKTQTDRDGRQRKAETHGDGGSGKGRDRDRDSQTVRETETETEINIDRRRQRESMACINSPYYSSMHEINNLTFPRYMSGTRTVNPPSLAIWAPCSWICSFSPQISWMTIKPRGVVFGSPINTPCPSPRAFSDGKVTFSPSVRCNRMNS